MNDKYITVTQLTNYIKYKIDNDENLDNVFLKGEISNFKAHSRGHYYFTLKDDNARINAIMFASSASHLKFMPQDGMKVLVTGKISVYPATGQYQIYVNSMLEDGLGALYLAYEQLKEKLSKEGLFDPAHKKPIPKYPKTIGIVTAPTGAAIKDILSTIKRRFPMTETILFPALVQGKEAGASISKQIKVANTYPIDVLIIGRGGGSIEDLWGFNEEIVARAIYESEVPIISAVGHEVDFTISDFVADLRAPTPTGAAEMAVPNLMDVKTLINQLEIRLNKSLLNMISYKKERLNKLKENYILKNPMSMYVVKEQQFDNLFERLINVTRSSINTNKNTLNYLVSSRVFANPMIMLEKKEVKFSNLVSKLESLSPLNTIKRGYSITKKDNKVIKSVKEAKKDDLLNIEVSDGVINTKVI